MYRETYFKFNKTQHDGKSQEIVFLFQNMIHSNTKHQLRESFQLLFLTLLLFDIWNFPEVKTKTKSNQV